MASVRGIRGVTFGAERGQHIFAGSLERVDAQIDGRAGLRGAHFVQQFVAQRAREFGFQKRGKFALHI